MEHDHPHGSPHTEMPFHEKALKLIEHWMKHNEAHSVEYRRWAATFRQHAMDEAADALESAAEQNEHINLILTRAKQEVHQPE